MAGVPGKMKQPKQAHGDSKLQKMSPNSASRIRGAATMEKGHMSRSAKRQATPR